MNAQESTFHIGANSDDDIRALPEGEYRQAFHLRSGVVTGSNEFSRESYLGNLLMNTQYNLPAGTNTIVGLCENIEAKSIMVFVYNSNLNHTIWLFNTLSEVFTRVAIGSYLGFSNSPQWVIVHSFVQNGLLFWSTGRFGSFVNNDYDEPRKLNIEKAILFTGGFPGGYTSMDRRTIDFIKWPPAFGPDAQYVTDTGFEQNFLYGKMYKFRYRYIYDDNEESALSPVSRLPLPRDGEYVQGRNWDDTQADNKLEVTIQTGPDIVSKIEVLVSVNDGPWAIFAKLDKTLLGINNNTTEIVDYFGNEALESVNLVQRNYDAVPLVSKGMEFLPTRQVCFGNYTEGFNKPDLVGTVTTVPVEIRNTFEPVILEIIVSVSPYTRLFISPSSNPAVWDATNVVVGDTYVFSLGSNVGTVSYTITQQDLDDIIAAANPEEEFLTIIGDFISTERGFAGSYVGPYYQWTGVGSTTIFAPVYFLNGTTKNVALRKTNARVGLFKGARHEFGVQYYDRANRDSTVITVGGLNLDVPLDPQQDRTDFTNQQNPYAAKARISIGDSALNTAPAYATHYQIVYRQPPVLSFQRRSVVDVSLDPQNLQLIKMNLEGDYESAYFANINHQIQVGDVVRIIRKGLAFATDLGDYVSSYIELTVSQYDAAGWPGGESIWVPFFDWQSVVDNDGFLIEIYTPATLTENTIWREIGEEFEVVNPATSTARHAGTVITGLAQDLVNGANTFRLRGVLMDTESPNLEYIQGYTFTIVSDVTYTGTITSAIFDVANQWTDIVASVNYTGSNPDGTITINLDQTATLPAIINVDFGNVYSRPRLMGTGFGFAGYYPIDDFYYSDYYVSNFNSVGRIAVELSDARQIRQQATIRHGGAYVDNTEINNLCRFDPTDIESVYAMDEQYGPINRMVMLGLSLKCLQDMKENSIYIRSTFGVLPGGQTQVGFTPKSQTFAGWNPSETLYGTIHPLSVQVVTNQLTGTQAMYYYDFLNNVVVKSMNNGQQDIINGRYKYNKEISDFKANLLTMAAADRWVSSQIDEANGEYALMSLDSRTGGSVHSHVFNYLRDRWDHRLYYAAFLSCNLGTYLVSTPVSSANIYKHNAGSENTFYGVQRNSVIQFATNDAPGTIKVPLSIGLKTDGAWGITALTEANASYPAMATSMATNVQRLLEGYYWTDYLNDETNVVTQIPGLATATLARMNGRQLRGYAWLNTLTITPTSRVKIFSAKTVFITSTPGL